MTSHGLRLTHSLVPQFNYTPDSSYFIGTIGFEEITCDFIDFTYVRSAALPSSCAS